MFYKYLFDKFLLSDICKLGIGFGVRDIEVNDLVLFCGVLIERVIGKLLFS